MQITLSSSSDLIKKEALKPIHVNVRGKLVFGAYFVGVNCTAARSHQLKRN